MAYKIVDLRNKIYGNPAASQGNQKKTNGIVIHYSGDPDGTTGVVSGSKTPQQSYDANARYHASINWGTSSDPAYTNGIQYHYGVWGDTVYILRNPTSKLWHCGDGTKSSSKNYSATAINVPISYNERATARTLQTLREFCDAELIKQGKTTRQVVGHKEVSHTTCPGSLMQDFVIPYRKSGPLSPIKPQPSDMEFPRWVFAARTGKDIIAASVADITLNYLGITNSGVIIGDNNIKAVTNRSINTKRHTSNHPGVPFTIVIGAPTKEVVDPSAILSLDKNLGLEASDVVSAIGKDYNETLIKTRAFVRHIAGANSKSRDLADVTFSSIFRNVYPELAKQHSEGLGNTVKIPTPQKPTKPVEPILKKREPNGIRGLAILPKEKVLSYAKAKGAKDAALRLIEGIYKYAPQKNIGADVLSVQMLIETGYGSYTGASKAYNPAGIKTKNATGDTPKDFEVPPNADEGARMLVNHWCAVFQLDPIGTPHGRYEVAKKVYKNKPEIKYISQLGNGNWAMDPNYGKKIADMLKAVEVGVTPQPTPVPETPDKKIDYSYWAGFTASVAREIATKFKVYADTYEDHGDTGMRYGIDLWISPLGVKANPQQEALGDAIQKYIESNWYRLKVRYMVYWDSYSESPGVWSYYDWRRYGKGNPNEITQRHLDHVHIQIQATNETLAPPMNPQLPGTWDKQKTVVPPGFRPLPVKSGSYLNRHPTRYEWRSDIEGLIKRIYSRWPNVHINTYVQHPGNDDGKWARDTIAFDVWGNGGRGSRLPVDIGNAICDYVFYDPNPPWIDWYIWQQRMWTRASGMWVPYGEDEFSWHNDHIHFTMTGPYNLLK